MNNTANDTSKLEDFVADRAARSRITFGDVRRLQRDYLPAGVSTCEEAELLIRLDGMVGRADRAWADWLVEAIVEFSLGSDASAEGQPAGARGRLKDILAAAGTKAARRITREIHRATGRVEPIAPIEPIVLFPAPPKNAVTQAVIFDTVGSPMNRLELAA
jgi:hypothetical protein